MGKKSLLLMGFLSLTMGWFFPIFPMLFVAMLVWHIYNNYIAAPSTYGYGQPGYNQPSSLLGSLFGGGGGGLFGGGGGLAGDAPPPYSYHQQQNQAYNYKAAAPAASGGGFSLPAVLSGAAAGYMFGRRGTPAAQPQYAPSQQYNRTGGPTVYDAGEPTHTSTSYATTKRR